MRISKRAPRWTGALLILALAPPAAAQRAASEVESAPTMVGGRGYVHVDHPDVVLPEPGIAHAPPSRVLYLNNCKPAGCVVTGAMQDDSRTDKSSIVSAGRHTLSAFAGDDATWQQIVACVRENYAPFEIEVVTTDPGDVPHYEAYAAGLGREAGFSGVLGVASFSCGIIPNAVSFSFLNEGAGLPVAALVDDACWTISQETAHNFGLSHSMLAADAMTYIPNPPRKRFVDLFACIGTQGCCQPTEECRCGLSDQNSVQRLLGSFGRAGATPPDIFLDEPNNTATVRPGFVVKATVTDRDGVAKVELLIDDAVVATATAAPYALASPANLTGGVHAVTVRATDGLGLTGQVNISVTVVEPCRDDAACAVGGADLVCVDGTCVPAPEVDEPAGCCDAGAGPGLAPALAGLVLAAVVTRRRRRA